MGESITVGLRRPTLPTINQRPAVALALVGVLATVVACGSDGRPSVLQPSDYPAALQRILDERPAPTDDVFEVFICDVPLSTTDPVFRGRDLRLPLTADGVATTMEDHVRPYFEALSHGQYHPHFIAGRTLTMSATETHDQCVERAVVASGADTAAVMVVANAENAATAPGGWGRPGDGCTVAFCPAAQTRRAVYVGASDFHPDWGAVPLLDLIEHEIGHTLGLPHSGDGSPGKGHHRSALDLMSNSAAPRDLVAGTARSDRKNAQGTLAINRLALGWLAPGDVVVVAAGGGRFDLSGSAGQGGLRLLVLPAARDASGEALQDSFLTVEYLAADGFDDFLPTAGIAVHRIEQAPAACGRPVDDDRPCTGIDRAQITLGSEAPHLELLHAVGDSWVLDGWTITVTSTGARVGVEVRRTER